MHHSYHGDFYANEIRNLKTLNDNKVNYFSTKKMTDHHHDDHDKKISDITV